MPKKKYKQEECNLRDTAQGTRELSINNQVEEKAILIETCHVTKMLTNCKLLCQTLSREANPHSDHTLLDPRPETTSKINLLI